MNQPYVQAALYSTIMVIFKRTIVFSWESLRCSSLARSSKKAPHVKLSGYCIAHFCSPTTKWAPSEATCDQALGPLQ